MPALIRIKNLELRIKLLLPLFLILIALFLPNPAFAQSTPNQFTSKESKPTFEVSEASPSLNTTYQIPNTISPVSPIYTDLLVHNMFHTFSCLAVGGSIIGQPCLTYQISQNAQGAIQSVPVLSSVNMSGGALGATTSLIGMLYANPPVRTIDYLASVGEDLGIVKTAHAQVIGSGAEVLKPILTLWQVSRNIAYLIMIIIFVVIGLMVMFRQRINPQTVITAQAALPGLVIGLILITFSYFLAGLITDTAFIGTNLVGYYFSAAQPPPPPDTSPTPPLAEQTTNHNVLTIMGNLIRGFNKEHFTNAIAAFFNALGDPGSFIELGIPPRINIDDPPRLVRMGAGLAAYQVGATIGPAIGGLVAGIGCGVLALPAFATAAFAVAGVAGWLACVQAGNVIGGPVGGSLLGGLTINDPAAYVGFAFWVIAILAILYTMIRLLMRLIRNFLTIIFLVIFAPFQLLFASLPGRQGLATNWIRNMLANVLAFPAVMAIFYFVNYLLGPIANSPFNVTGTSLDITTNLPILGGLDTAFIRILLAFGALVTTPAIPDIIIRTVGRAGEAGQLIGQEFGGAVAGGRGYLGRAQGGLGAMQSGVTGLGQFADQTTIEYSPPAEGIRPQEIGRRIQPGLRRRIFGR